MPEEVIVVLLTKISIVIYVTTQLWNNPILYQWILLLLRHLT